MKYTFDIYETLHKSVTIEADNYENAKTKVVSQYVNEEIVLSADDWATTTIECENQNTGGQIEVIKELP